MPTRTSTAWAAKLSWTVREMSSSMDTRMRGATSSSRTSEPSDWNTVTSWAPVLPAPTTASRRGTSGMSSTCSGTSASSAPGHGQAAGVPADAEHHRVAADPAPGVRQLHGVRVDEAGAALQDEVDAEVGQPLGLGLDAVDLLDHLADPGHGAGPVDHRVADVDAVAGGRADLADEARGLGQDAGRDAAGVDARAAGPAGLEQPDAGAQLGGAQGGGGPGRPGPDDEDLVAADVGRARILLAGAGRGWVDGGRGVCRAHRPPSGPLPPPGTRARSARRPARRPPRP